MRAPIRIFLPLFCFAALSLACSGGDGGGSPTEPPPARAILELQFANVEVIDDCDGIEGDGDFEFIVMVVVPGSHETYFKEFLNLGPGGKSRALGTKRYEIPLVEGAGVTVEFTATERDKTILGVEYADERLNNAWGSLRHRYSSNGWSSTGDRSITLGVPDCMVKLNWRAVGI